MFKISQQVRIIFAACSFLVCGGIGDSLYCANGQGIPAERVDWLKFSGSVSLSELNSKCDLLAIGSVRTPPQLVSNSIVTEITIVSVLATRSTNCEAILSEYLRTKMAKVYLFDEAATLFHGNTNTILVPGGDFLLWLNNVETLAATATANSNSVSTNIDNIRALHLPRVSITFGSHGAYLLNGIEKIQQMNKLRFPLYPWQEQFLNDLIKSNDVSQLQRIVVDMARALKSDKTSRLLLESMSKRASDPVLAGIAKDHLDKGVTNIFNYVNPGPIP